MIEDVELAALFKAECEEHLQMLDEGLLCLENGACDAAQSEQLFRAAHSLKGTARMLGVGGVEVVAHRFEDALALVRRAPQALAPDAADRLSNALQAMRLLVQEAASGEVANVDLSAVLANLDALDAPSSPAPRVELVRANDLDSPTFAASEHAIPLPGAMPPAPETASSTRASSTKREDANPLASEPELASRSEKQFEKSLTKEETPDWKRAQAPLRVPTAGLAPSSNQSSFPNAALVVDETPAAVSSMKTVPDAALTKDVAVSTVAAPFQIETMRVEPARLDALTTLAGELIVTTTRLSRGLAEVGALADLLEEWSKDAPGRLSARRLSASVQAGASLEEWERFCARRDAQMEHIEVLLAELHRATADDGARLRAVSQELAEGIRNVRLLPLSTIFSLFGRMVRDQARESDKEVRLIIEGGETTADKRVLEELKDPLMHIVRNAVDHGIETPEAREQAGKPRAATLTIRAYRTAINVVVEIIDDGRGLDEVAIARVAKARRVASDDELGAMSREEIQRLILKPGFSTAPLVTDLSGRGVGLDVVATNVERLKGSLHLESKPGAGCTFRLRLPISVATTRVLLARVAGHTYALPVEAVEGMRLVAPDEIFTIKGRQTIRIDGRPVSVAHARDVLEVKTASSTNAENPRLRPCVILASGDERLGLFVDELTDEQEIILKPLGAMLKRVRNVAGATILGTGEVCMVLHPADILKSVRVRGTFSPMPELESAAVVAPKLILLVDDSITTRTQEKRILEAAGYEVVVAVDGSDAWGKIATRAFDAIVSDVEMPNMNGLELTTRIRGDAKYKEIPIILVTSLASDADRARGAEAGANAYITKGSFDQKVLIETVRRLV